MRLSEVSTLSRENNLNIIRLIAATAVMFGHGFAMLKGNHYEFLPGINSAWFGFLAVAVFFGISGFLITQSFVTQKNWKKYLESRCLRIFPALIFANLITVLLVAIVVKNQTVLELVSDSDNWGYLFYTSIFRFTHFLEPFKSLPINGANGSLWTLPIEFRMYLFVLLIGLMGFFKRRFLVLLLAAFFISCVVFRVDFVVGRVFKILFAIQTYDGTFTSLPLCFGMGMLAYLYREYLRLNIFVAIAGLILSMLLDGWLIKAIAYIYAAFVLGYSRRLYLPQVNFRSDISYGVYVLAWPIQQIYIFLKITENPYILFFLTFGTVLPLALLSWHLVEKPALQLKGKLSSFSIEKIRKIFSEANVSFKS